VLNNATRPWSFPTDPGGILKEIRELQPRDKNQKQRPVSPALIDLDYSDGSGGPNFMTKPERHEITNRSTAKVNAVAKINRKDDRFIMINAHFPNPTNQIPDALKVDKKPDLETGDKVDHTKYQVELSELLDSAPPNKHKDAWNKEVDTVIGGLKALQRKHVVVLWRPLHEMNGNWFWWSGKYGHKDGKPDPSVFQQLWKDMFHKFQKKGVNNVLWVYSVNEPGLEVDSVFKYYPGDEFVDVLMVDSYGDSPTGIQGVSSFKTPNPSGAPPNTNVTQAKSKPIGLEYGVIDSHPGVVAKRLVEGDKGSFDDLITALHSNLADLTFFVNWNSVWGLGSHEGGWELLHDHSVLNLEDLNPKERKPDFPIRERTETPTD
jgi:hypothetical protein